MIQDGWGYGKSPLWAYYAKDIVKAQKEDCPHLEKIFVNICYDSTYPQNVSLKMNCSACHISFPKSQDILTRKFLEFYGK